MRPMLKVLTGKPLLVIDYTLSISWLNNNIDSPGMPRGTNSGSNSLKTPSISCLQVDSHRQPTTTPDPSNAFSIGGEYIVNHREEDFTADEHDTVKTLDGTDEALLSEFILAGAGQQQNNTSTPALSLPSIRDHFSEFDFNRKENGDPVGNIDWLPLAHQPVVLAEDRPHRASRDLSSDQISRLSTNLPDSMSSPLIRPSIEPDAPTVRAFPRSLSVSRPTKSLDTVSSFRIQTSEGVGTSLSTLPIPPASIDIPNNACSSFIREREGPGILTDEQHRLMKVRYKEAQTNLYKAQREERSASEKLKIAQVRESEAHDNYLHEQQERDSLRANHPRDNKEYRRLVKVTNTCYRKWTRRSKKLIFREQEMSDAQAATTARTAELSQTESKNQRAIFADLGGPARIADDTRRLGV